MLFFVSVGMLVDPLIVVNDPGWLFATLLIIVIGKSLAAFAIVRLFGYPVSHALTISASLAQIGEFSFILAGLGVSLALLPPHGRDLILAGAILSILLNPVLFVLLDRYLARGKLAASATDLQAAAEQALREPIRPTELSGHVVLVGFGRVGSLVSEGLRSRGLPMLLIEESRPLATHARAAGIEVMHGNAASAEVLKAANLPGARHLIVAIPDAFEGGQIVMQARKINPTLPILARSHSEEETAHLKSHGATTVIMGEHEIAMAMLADLQSGRPGG